MRMRWLGTWLGLDGLVGAQEKVATTAPEKYTQKMIEVKNADAGRVARLVEGPGLSVKFDTGMHVIVVRGPQEGVAAVEEMVRKLDVAPPNIELTVYLVSGSAQGSADDLPKELAGAAKQLHALFPYTSYRLLESFVQRSRDGRDASTSGVLPGTKAKYDFQFKSATVSGGPSGVVHIDGMSLTLHTPTSTLDKNGQVVYRSVGIRTDIDVREGQKAVVGKSSIDGTNDALILIVTAKVIE